MCVVWIKYWDSYAYPVAPRLLKRLYFLHWIALSFCQKCYNCESFSIIYSVPLTNISILTITHYLDYYSIVICLPKFFFSFINLFIYFWLCWVFVAARGLSLLAASGGYSLLQCAGFSLSWLLLLQKAGSRHVGFSSCGTRAQ